MKTKLPGLVAGVLVVSLIYGCGIEDASVNPDINPEITDFDAFIQFDTAHYMFTLVDMRDYQTQVYEKAVNWEQSLGEPFIDVNGNGIYEASIDSFIKALDPAVNQDLNRNNRYDGPNDPWEEGIPFDDIDGDGVRDNADDGGKFYEPGMAFSDFDGDGIRDSGVSTSGELVSISATTGLCGDTWYTTHEAPMGTYVGYRFVSDSGQVYDHKTYWSWGFDNLTVTDSGLIYYAEPLGGNYDDPLVPVLVVENGDFAEVTDELQEIITVDSDTIIVSRTVRLNETLEVGGYSFDQLMMVELEGATFEFEFYFERDHGIRAFTTSQLDSVSHEVLWYRDFYYLDFVDKADSIFLPMTR